MNNNNHYRILTLRLIFKLNIEGNVNRILPRSILGIKVMMKILIKKCKFKIRFKIILREYQLCLSRE